MASSVRLAPEVIGGQNVGMQRSRLTAVHFPVRHLKVPTSWPVGEVTFQPAGVLQRRLARMASQRPDPTRFHAEAAAALRGWEWATAQVMTRASPPRWQVPTDDLRETVRDAIAVLRLYQRECVPYEDLDEQTFGLVSDIGSETERFWQLDRAGLRWWGLARTGVCADFAFTRDHIATFRARPAFAYLDDALRCPDDRRSPFQKRAIAAVRTLNLASAMQRQPQRVILQAVALEALLGDDQSSSRSSGRHQAHPVARRSAFVTCEVDGARLPAGNQACLCLTADQQEFFLAPEVKARPRDYWDWPCTYYWHIRQVFDGRNAALHAATDEFPRRTAVRFEGRVDAVILATLDWVATVGATGLADLDDAIATLPVAR